MWDWISIENGAIDIVIPAFDIIQHGFKVSDFLIQYLKLNCSWLFSLFNIFSLGVSKTDE